MSESYWIQPSTHEVVVALYDWCRHRGIYLIDEDCDRFMSALSFANVDDEVRWGRALKEMMVDVESEMSARDLDRDIHHKSCQILGQELNVSVYTPHRFKHSYWFVQKYPELRGLLE